METAAIWKQYSSDLNFFILKKVGEKEVAQDILQEVFIKVHLHKTEIREIQSLKSWLFRVTNNAIIDFFRKREKSFEIPETLSSVESTEKHSPEHCLLPLINNLSSIYRDALLLSEIEGKRHSEVAKLLQISLPAAKSRILRGKRLLQQGFMECCDYQLSRDGVLTGEHKSFSECKVCN